LEFKIIFTDDQSMVQLASTHYYVMAAPPLEILWITRKCSDDPLHHRPRF